jgi:uncharacterized protein
MTSIKVIAHPGSKKPRVAKDSEGNLHIYIKEQAIEGRANKAVLKALAGHLGVVQQSIVLKSGLSSKIKIFKYE